jgi:hypothetical protein
VVVQRVGDELAYTLDTGQCSNTVSMFRSKAWYVRCSTDLVLNSDPAVIAIPD